MDNFFSHGQDFFHPKNHVDIGSRVRPRHREGVVSPKKTKRIFTHQVGKSKICPKWWFFKVIYYGRIREKSPEQRKTCHDGTLKLTARPLKIERQCLVGGFNPFEKYESKWESSPNRYKNKKSLKPPTSFFSPAPLLPPSADGQKKLPTIPSFDRFLHLELSMWHLFQPISLGWRISRGRVVGWWKWEW